MTANTALAEVDRFASWRAALAGEKPGMQMEEPWCGYFMILDRRFDADGQKRQWQPCAIWIDWRGNLAAEVNGDSVPVSAIWPYCAKRPISFEEYTKLHEERSS